MQRFEQSIGSVIIYHRTDGPFQMYEADAIAACREHPSEWSRTPWDAPAPEAQPAFTETKFARADLVAEANANRERIEQKARDADEKLKAKQRAKL